MNRVTKQNLKTGNTLLCHIFVSHPLVWDCFQWFEARVIGLMGLAFLGMEFSRSTHRRNMIFIKFSSYFLAYICVHSNLFRIKPDNSCCSIKTVYYHGFVMHTEKC